jgi:hypothetical protein
MHHSRRSSSQVADSANIAQVHDLCGPQVSMPIVWFQLLNMHDVLARFCLF